MQRTAVLNVVGLTPELVGAHAPFLKQWAGRGKMVPVDPVLPAVTCTVQATYLTGTPPAEHGIVGNGWYFRDTSEVRFWLRSGQIIQGKKLWDVARERNPDFTCANLFWRYAAYSGADYTVIERPMYPADGRKIPDIYAQPGDLRPALKERLGPFPLFEFWGPSASIRSSQWIADAARFTEERYAPSLSLIYLPHLDYVLQREGPAAAASAREVQAIDAVCAGLIPFLETRGVQVLLLSEYGITPVHMPVHLNRVLRRHGYLTIREELGGELLDAGASSAFAVADHQLAHIYVSDPADRDDVRGLLEAVPGVASVLGEEEKAAHDLDHPRAGDLVALASPNAWFTYYYWLDDRRAPDFARTVAIHDKPGYDPVELFVDPALRFPKLKAGQRLLQKKLGFRYVMDLIPLDATLVKGSHGLQPPAPRQGPLFATPQPDLLPQEALHATSVYDAILAHLFETS